MKKTSLLMLIGSLLTAPALADASKFAGANIGLNLKSTRTSFNYSEEDYTADFSKRSTIGAVQAGYTLAFGKRFTLGTQLNLTLGNAKIISDSPEWGDSALTGTRAQAISLEPGWAVSDKTLIYGLVSYNSMKLKVTAPNFYNSISMSGKGYGVGVRHKLTPLLYAQVEANAVDYTPTYDEADRGVVKSSNALLGIGFQF